MLWALRSAMYLCCRSMKASSLMDSVLEEDECRCVWILQ
jgi:hypothetical protein